MTTAPRAAGPPRLGPAGGLSVLVVDDSDDVAQSFAELLALYGHTVRTAGCGADALAAAAAAPPDVVLLDLMLPGMSGWEVARGLRAQAVGPQPLVVVVSGCDATADRHRSADAGVDLHLAKPIDPAELVKLLTWVATARAAGRGH